MRTALFTILVVLTLAATTPRAAWADLNVVATLPDLAAIADVVGGDHVEVTALVAPSQDPHFVDARPNYVVALNRADLLIANGLELEIGWLPQLQTQARNPEIGVGGDGYFEATSAVDLLGIPTGRVDRSQGDVHAGGNPHITFDPRRGAQVAIALGERMSALDPGNATAYRANAEQLAADLRAFAEVQRARFDAMPAEGRRFVAYHASLIYLSDWLGLEQVATLEPRPGVPPDPGHVASVLETIRSTGARAIIQESFYPGITSSTIGNLADIDCVEFRGGTDFGDETYLEHLQDVADDIYEALQ